MAWIGFATLLCAVGLFLVAGLGWTLDKNVEPSATSARDPSDPISEGSRWKEGQRRWATFWVALAVLLCGLFFLSVSKPKVDHVPPAPSGGAAGAGAPKDTLSAPGSNHEEHTGEQHPAPLADTWPLVGMAGIAIIVGAVLMLRGQNRFVQAAGMVTIGTGLVGPGYLIKEFNIGEIFKMENKFEIEAEIAAQLQKFARVGLEHFTPMDGFESGKSTLKLDMKSKIDDVCVSWQNRHAKGYQGLLIIIGATDRVPMNSQTRLQYESNFGLARARAEQVKSKIVECGVPAPEIMVLVSGPRNTPEIPLGRKVNDGYSEDRRVDVWAFWTLPEESQKEMRVKLGNKTAKETRQ
jgi:hypothetical protein